MKLKLKETLIKLNMNNTSMAVKYKVYNADNEMKNLIWLLGMDSRSQLWFWFTNFQKISQKRLEISD